MARYYKDNYFRIETCVIDRENYTIHVPRPVSFIALHRELCDLFDDIEWIVDIAPTVRYDDQHGCSVSPWKFENIEMIRGTFERWCCDEDDLYGEISNY